MTETLPWTCPNCATPVAAAAGACPSCGQGTRSVDPSEISARLPQPPPSAGVPTRRLAEEKAIRALAERNLEIPFHASRLGFKVGLIAGMALAIIVGTLLLLISAKMGRSVQGIDILGMLLAIPLLGFTLALIGGCGGFLAEVIIRSVLDLGGDTARAIAATSPMSSGGRDGNPSGHGGDGPDAGADDNRITAFPQQEESRSEPDVPVTCPGVMSSTSPRKGVMVRTRFAPSPTGFLHIGGVRTALFNWLFTRRHGGQFILRIDDTDQQRNLAEALAPILEGLRWVGIDWDEGVEVGGAHGPYYQSQKQDRYRAAVEELLAKGLAYHDYATKAELEAEGKEAEKAKRPFIYGRRWMAETAAQRAQFEAEGRTDSVRLKMPREGVCAFYDHIRGDMRVEWAREQDHVIRRADGTCLYHLASVVDDHDMRITHVIRAEEHLSNTPRQIFIARGLGYELPEYAHLPFVAEPGSKNKLSKRKIAQYLKNADFKKIYDHGQAIAAAIGLKTSAETFNPVIVDFYEQVGYLPDAVVNYLLLLGWSLDDKTEFFTRAEMIRHFSLESVNKAPASFDPKKLFAFQDAYMQRLTADEKIDRVLPFLQRAGLVPSSPPVEVSDKLTQVLRAAGDRVKVAGDILDYDFVFRPDDQLRYDDKAFDKRLRKPPEAAGLLRKFRQRLETVERFDAAALEQLLQDFVKAEGVEVGQVIHALRVAVSGKAVGFGLFETLAVLGKDPCLARIDLALARL
jgi:glutamyl-tRNA synthetase